MYAALENMGNLVDYGELAARLGSIVSFNREGNIIFWDDFEKTPLKWGLSAPGVGSTAGYSNEEALSGGQSVKLHIGAVSDDTSQMYRYFPRFATGKQGMEIAFSNQDRDYKFSFQASLRRATELYHMHVRIDFINDKIELLDENDVWQDVVTGMAFAYDVNLFHTFKVVVDSEAKRYTRIMIDRNEYNVAEYGFLSAPVPGIDSYQISMSIKNYAAVASSLYLDNFILTQNEP